MMTPPASRTISAQPRIEQKIRNVSVHQVYNGEGWLGAHTQTFGVESGQLLTQTHTQYTTSHSKGPHDNAL